MTPEITQPLVGGSLATDLLNTVWQHNGEPFDWLGDDAAVVEFAERNGQPTAPAAIPAARAALVSARVLVGRLFDEGRAEGVSRKLTAEIDAILAETAVRLDPESMTVEIVGQPGSNTVAVAAVLDAVRLLADRPERIRNCHHTNCTLWFVDTSKGGRRRWCSMETCGNRTKARRHYDRQHR